MTVTPSSKLAGVITMLVSPYYIAETAKYIAYTYLRRHNTQLTGAEAMRFSDPKLDFGTRYPTRSSEMFY